jgi:hypothetical protein
MPDSQADRAMLYASYAEICLKAATILPDRDTRVVHREMAAEWLILANQAATLDQVLGEQLAGETPRRTKSIS